MTIDLTFDGSTECRGRNRWFQLRSAEIMLTQYEPGVMLDIFSSKRGKMAPIILHFHNPEELRTLICGLAKALAQMTAKDNA